MSENKDEKLNYIVLNPIHNTFKICPMIIDKMKCDNNFEININKHLSILTAQKYYKNIYNIFNRKEYPYY